MNVKGCLPAEPLTQRLLASASEPKIVTIMIYIGIFIISGALLLGIFCLIKKFCIRKFWTKHKPDLINPNLVTSHNPNQKTFDKIPSIQETTQTKTKFENNKKTEPKSMQIVNIEAGESDSPNVHKVKASLASYGKRYLKKIYGKGNEQAILDKKSRKSSETDPMDDQLAKNKSGKGMKDHKQDMDYVKQINRVENSINNTSYEQNSISMISKQSTVENEKSVILEYGKTD